MINSELLSNLGREGELLARAVSDIFNTIVSGNYETVVSSPCTSFLTSSFEVIFNNYARGLIKERLFETPLSLYNSIPVDHVGMALLSLPQHVSLSATDPRPIESIHKHVALSGITLNLIMQLSESLISLPDTGENNAIIAGINEFISAVYTELFSGSISNLYATPHYFSNPTADIFKLSAIDELLFLTTCEINSWVEGLIV